MQGNRRVIVVSDLHLGGDVPHMMSHPRELASFIGRLPLRLASDEQLELIINGDFIDFLAVSPWSSWTRSPTEAVTKLQTAYRPPFEVVFDALAQHVSQGHRLTIVLGNHDIELAYHAVQADLIRRVGVKRPETVHFVEDGSALRVGGLLIEHGNRYDPANLNDWERLRSARSRTSRGEVVAEFVRPSVGSDIVTHVVNPLKRDYPFIDLIQPQGELLALLLLVLEPSLAFEFGKIARALRGARLQAVNPRGEAPQKTYQAGAGSGEEIDTELADVFGEHYRQMRRGSSEPAGITDLADALNQARRGGLREHLATGTPVPPDRLSKLRTIFRRLASPEDTFSWSGDTGPYGEAAKRILAATAVDTVVMGHTHLARREGSDGKARYINTGTWADLVRVPRDAIADGEAGLVALEGFLRRLVADSVRVWEPTYADVRLNPDGAVVSADLQRAESWY
jgi:UDP-2,3-diacylglucosamine pyrophosphatase LpxH